jgi:hypothetical protein
MIAKEQQRPNQSLCSFASFPVYAGKLIIDGHNKKGVSLKMQ